MRYASRTVAALGVASLGTVVGATFAIDDPTVGSFFRAFPGAAMLVVLPALVLGAVRPQLVYRLATAAVSVMSLGLAHLGLDHYQRTHPELGALRALALLLIPFYGVGLALAFLVVGVIVRAREAADVVEPVSRDGREDAARRTVFLRGAIKIPSRAPRGE